MASGLAAHFRMLGRYNRLANARLYGACSELDDEDRKRDRGAFFGSIHGTLNHLLVGDRIFVSASYGTGALLLDAAGEPPEKIWTSNDALSNHYATSVYRDGYLYGFHGRQEYGPSLRCVEWRTGRVEWNRDGLGAGTVTLAGDRLLILTERGELILAAADPEGFRVISRAKVLEGTVRAYPALAGGRLYARNEKALVCVDLRK